MYFIRDNLAVCGFHGIGSRESFAAYGFAAQLQCTGPFDEWLPECVEVKAAPFSDGEPIPPALFRDAMHWIGGHWRAQSRILISCAAGQSRSVSMAIAALHANTGQRFADCIAEVMGKVPRAYPHPRVLASAAKLSGEPIDLRSLQRVYANVSNPPPYPWRPQDVRDALDQS